MTTTWTSEPRRPDAGLLLKEIERYLAVVEAFRREGREPRWQAERSER
jgi:hypothetical protein